MGKNLSSIARVIDHSLPHPTLADDGLARATELDSRWLPSVDRFARCHITVPGRGSAQVPRGKKILKVDKG